jgi:hypothetical protein
MHLQLEGGINKAWAKVTDSGYVLLFQVVIGQFESTPPNAPKGTLENTKAP